MSKGLFGLIAALLALLLVAVVGFGVYFATRPGPLDELASRAKADDGKVGIARAAARQIGEACELYRDRYDETPPNLESLTQPQPDGTPAYFAPEKLLDPWKKVYQYNPQGPNNGGNKPDVWTTTPAGKTVGNW